MPINPTNIHARACVIATLTLASLSAQACRFLDQKLAFEASPDIVTSTSGIYFASSSILPIDPNQVARVLAPYRGNILRVVGHSDRSPVKTSPGAQIKDNLSLSLERARSIARIVRKITGLRPTAITIDGCSDRVAQVVEGSYKLANNQFRRVVELQLWLRRLSVAHARKR